MLAKKNFLFQKYRFVPFGRSKQNNLFRNPGVQNEFAKIRNLTNFPQHVFILSSKCLRVLLGMCMCNTREQPTSNPILTVSKKKTRSHANPALFHEHASPGNGLRHTHNRSTEGQCKRSFRGESTVVGTAMASYELFLPRSINAQNLRCLRHHRHNKQTRRAVRDCDPRRRWPHAEGLCIIKERVRGKRGCLGTGKVLNNERYSSAYSSQTDDAVCN